MKKKSLVILFDGVCNLCNGSVLFIIKRDKLKVFKFASLQSDFANKLIGNHNNSIDFQSIILVDNQDILKESDAVLEISKYLGWKWKVIGQIGRIFPQVLRNKIYQIIAKNRYHWFGKKDSCMIPTTEIRNRFLD